MMITISCSVVHCHWHDNGIMRRVVGNFSSCTIICVNMFVVTSLYFFSGIKKTDLS